MQTNARILISGAGVAGLGAAIALGRAGLRPVVVERAPDVRADGYIVSLSHRSYRSAERLGLLPDLLARRSSIRASSYHNPAGRALLKLDYRQLFSGLDVLQIMRDELQRVLYRHAAELAEFRFGTVITGLEQAGETVHVETSDGVREAYDVVIGADGLHSGVRGLAFDPADVNERFLGLCAAAYRLPNVAGLEHKFETHMQRDRYMVRFSTGAGDLAAVFVWASADRSIPPPAERAAHLRRAFAGSPDLVESVLQHAPTGADCGPRFYMDPLVQIEMPRWSRGRVALVGDAAHCMTLLSGQGASTAFAGATLVAEALTTGDPETAFQRYHDALYPTVTRVQAATRDAARWYVPRHRLRQTLRDLAMDLMPNAYFQRYFRQKYSRA